MNKQLIKDEFKERLNVLKGDMSCVAFAKKAEITRQAMNHYIKGIRRPDIVILAKICQAYDVSCDWLLGLSDIRKPKSLGMKNTLFDTVEIKFKVSFAKENGRYVHKIVDQDIASLLPFSEQDASY